VIHFVPDSEAAELQAPYAEAVARLAGLRQALALVEGLAGVAASPPPANENAIATLNRDTRKAWFDARSARAVAGSAAGLEAIAALNEAGGQAHPAAAERLASDIRVRLEELGAVLSL
jgi:hypothetical protein